MDISNIIYYLWTHAKASKSHIQTFFWKVVFFRIELNFFFFLLSSVTATALLPESEGCRFDSQVWVLSIWFLHVLPVFAWVLSRYIRLTCNSRIRCECECYCFFVSM